MKSDKVTVGETKKSQFEGKTSKEVRTETNKSNIFHVPSKVRK